MKNKNVKILLQSLAFFALLSGVSLGLYNSVSANPPDRNSSSSVKQPGDANEVVGSIVTTDNPEAIKNHARLNNLKVDFAQKIPGSIKSRVVLQERPDNPKIKAIQVLYGDRVDANYAYKSLYTPTDPNYGNQWNLRKIGAPKAWDITRGNSSVVIAVIDSGILSAQTINGATYTQEEFPASRIWNNSGETGTTQSGDPCWTGTAEDKSTNDCDDDANGYVDDWRGWDFMGGFRGDDAGCPNLNDSARYESESYPGLVAQDNDPQPYSCDSPDSPSVLNKNHFNGTCSAFTSACYVGHGTMVASVAVAEPDNGHLIAGMDHNAKLMNVRTMDGYGYSTTARLVAGIEYSTDNGADVINMSLGGMCSNNDFTDSVVESALDRAVAIGVLPVAASGNEYHDSSICYPASSKYVVSVGATDENDKRKGYSNGSNKLDIVAPAGVPVANAPSSAINTKYYKSANGTSLSTPHVAGVAALHFAMNDAQTPGDVKKKLVDSAFKVKGMGGKNRKNGYGYGRLNVYESLYAGYLRAARKCDISASNKYSLTDSTYRMSVAGSKGYIDDARTQQFTTSLTVGAGAKAYICLKARNTGTQSWNRNSAKLGTADPNDSTSVFQDASWLTYGRVAGLYESSVVRGGVGTFELTFQAPAETGTYVEKFNGLAEGISWFWNPPVAFKLHVVEPVAASNSSNVGLAPGEQLKAGEYLLSPDRHSALLLQKDGNLVLRTNFRKVWSSGTKGKNFRLVMQGDGNLVLYNGSGNAVWHAQTNGNPGSRLATQTDGDLVIYDSSNQPLWSTNTIHLPNNLKMVNTTLPTSRLEPGQQLQTADRKYRLVLQGDGNLVLYSQGGALWASGTDGKKTAFLAMQGDGNLVLYSSGGKAIWHTNTNGLGPSKLVMQQDGNLVLYKNNGTPTWHTKTYGLE